MAIVMEKIYTDIIVLKALDLKDLFVCIVIVFMDITQDIQYEILSE